MKVLVTGSTGFLGRHLIKKLNEINFEVFVSNQKIANLNDVKNLYIYNNIKFDYIFHLAVDTKPGKYLIENKGDQWLKNQIMNTNILLYWKEYQSQAKMIAMGSSGCYSEDYIDDMREENYLLGEPEKELYTYAMTKRMLLIGLKSLQNQYGLKWLYFVPSIFYGPEFDLDDGHFIFDLIRKIYKGKEINSDVEIWGDGNQRREMIYVEDATKIIIDLLSLENEILNLGTGKDYSINEYVELLCKKIGLDKKKLYHNTNKYSGIKYRKLNINKIIKNIGEIEFTSIDHGIEKTLSYYIKNIKL